MDIFSALEFCAMFVHFKHMFFREHFPRIQTFVYNLLENTMFFFLFCFVYVFKNNLNININFVYFLFDFRTKYLKALAKSGESPFFLCKNGKNPIFRYIYELLNDGIRGTTKKDAVTTILSDIAVK